MTDKIFNRYAPCFLFLVLSRLVSFLPFTFYLYLLLFLLSLSLTYLIFYLYLFFLDLLVFALALPAGFLLAAFTFGCCLALTKAEPPPILNIFVPQTEQVPERACLPFFIVICFSFFISLFDLHFTQYACVTNTRQISCLDIKVAAVV
jgi:hypothetical protein